jgi:sugar phosphate isomerase/epimerase
VIGVKLAFVNTACPSWSWETTFAKAVEYGYDGVEFYYWQGKAIQPDMSPQDRREAARILRDAPLPAVCMGSFGSVYSLDKFKRRANVERIIRYMDLAAEFGIPLLRVTPGVCPPIGLEMRMLADSILELGEHAKSMGIRIGIESAESFCRANILRDLMQLCEHEAIGLLWDVHNTSYRAEHPGYIYENFERWLTHVHVTDLRFMFSVYEAVPAGEGSTELDQILIELIKHRYDGYVSVLWNFGVHSSSTAPEIILPQYFGFISDVCKTHGGRWLAAQG